MRYLLFLSVFTLSISTHAYPLKPHYLETTPLPTGGNWIIILSIVLTSLLLITTIVTYIIMRRRKNILSKQIEQKENHAKIQMIRQKEKEEELFNQIDKLLSETKCYTDSSLDRHALAQLVSSNVTYIASAIHNVGGLTFAEYINRYRLEYACQLIQEDPKRSINSVCYESGFGTISLFYRRFAEQYGITPGKYVQKVKANSELLHNTEESLD
jgi:AraC-like DNA-binding protein